MNVNYAEINTGVRKNDINLLNSNLPVNKDDSSNEFVGVEHLSNIHTNYEE